jgi:uncharacterized protein YndB with AHSA1/START domain
MARSFYVEETISKPASEVWAAITDWDSAHEWMRGIDRMEADRETAEGTKLTFYARGAERESSVARFEPGHLIVLRSVQGGVTADYTYEVHPQGDETRVTLLAECSFTGLWKIAAPMIRVAIKMTDGGQLKDLKGFVERG